MEFGLTFTFKNFQNSKLADAYNVILFIQYKLSGNIQLNSNG